MNSGSVPEPILSIRRLEKRYASGLQALKGVDLEIRRGEIFALLGPNGAGKTTLINIVCGIVTPSGGTVTVAGHDILREPRAARELIGLVPQELAITPFESVGQTVAFSRGLFGRPANAAFIEKVLKDVALWERRQSRIITLSGGMKRRVLIAKALAHEPQVLFLDEPTAGVDVELRQGMWQVVRELRDSGVTIILTTHYIEEAELMADRVGVINKGEIVLVEEKAELMRKLGRKQLTLQLQQPIVAIPAPLAPYRLSLASGGRELVYTYDTQSERTRITQIEGVPYGAFIVPGLVMLTLLTQSVTNASFGIYFPRFTGTIYEILSAPISALEIVIGYVGAAATKSVILGLIILATAGFFVPLRIAHPLWMLAFLFLTAATFSLFGFIIGLWADGFEQLQFVPLL